MRAAVRFVQRLFCVENPLRLTAFASSPEKGSFLHACKLSAKAGKFAVVPPQSRLAPCQLPQGDAFGTATKFPFTAKAVPLGKVAANAVSRRKGYSAAAPRFRRKQALQMQFPATTPPVKKASVALRRVRQTQKFKIIFPLNMARAQRRPFKIVPRPAGERAQKAPPCGGANSAHNAKLCRTERRQGQFSFLP